MKTKLKINITIKDLLELVRMSRENNIDLEIITGEEEKEEAGPAKKQSKAETAFSQFDEDFETGLAEISSPDSSFKRKLTAIKDSIKKSGESKEDLASAMELCRKSGFSVLGRTSKRSKKRYSSKRSKQIEERARLGITKAKARRDFELKNLPWFEKSTLDDLEILGYTTIGDLLDSSATELSEKWGVRIKMAIKYR